MQGGGTLLLLGNPSANGGVNIHAANVIVEAGGKVSADGSGYPGTPGTGGGAGAWGNHRTALIYF